MGCCRRHSAFIGMALCALFACSNQPRRTGRRSGLARADTLRTSTRLTIGTRTDSDSDRLGRVYAAFLRGGRIFVANGEVPEIREYDIAGHLQRIIGRRGRGPGEFDRLRFIAPLAPDSLVALDAGSQRASVFDREGRYVRSADLHLGLGRQAEFVIAFGTGFVVGISRGFDPRTLTLDGIARDSFNIEIVDRNFQKGTADRLPAIGGMWWRKVPAAGSQRVQAIIDGPMALASIRDDVVMVSSSDVQQVLRSQGDHWEVVPLSGQSWSNGTVAGTPAVHQKLYDQLVSGLGGDFWLSDASLDASNQRLWRVFNAAGVLRSVLLLPASFQIWQIDSNVVLGKRVDDDGIEYVELLKIRADSMN